MSRQLRWTAPIAVVALLMTHASAQVRTGRPGDPLAGLTPQEFEEFRLGLEDFLEVETSEEGLGPAYNGTSCAVCHNVPAVGGVGTIAEVRAARRSPNGGYDSIDSTGESLYQLFSIPDHGCQPMVPPEADHIVRRVPLPLFGAGLVEAIDDDTLLALQDPDDRNGDGVSGRAAIVTDRGTGARRVGRFGWKAQHATLLAFAADAYRNEMGITNDLFPAELALGVTADRMRVCDPIPDPEDIRDPRTRRRGIDNFESFMRFLAPLSPAAADGNGQRVFAAIGCAACHVPALMTGAHATAQLHRQPVPLYSDLLLHDVGTEDGIRQGAADPDEIRTPALWGLRFRRPLLHDGSASTITDAILRHAHEAELARLGFEQLRDEDRAALLRFLSSL